MAQAIRSILAVLGGLCAAFLVVGLVEAAGQLVFPLPAGTDVSSPAAIAKIMKQVPTGALIVILVAWAGGAFAGGLVASAGARRGKTARAMVFAGLFLLGTLANLMMIPHPVWVQAIGLAEIVPAAYFGSTLTGPRTKDSKPEVAAELA